MGRLKEMIMKAVEKSVCDLHLRGITEEMHENFNLWIRSPRFDSHLQLLTTNQKSQLLNCSFRYVHVYSSLMPC